MITTIATWNVGGGGVDRDQNPLYGDFTPLARDAAWLAEVSDLLMLQEVPVGHPWHRGVDGKVQNGVRLLDQHLPSGWSMLSLPYLGTDRLRLVTVSPHPLDEPEILGRVAMMCRVRIGRWRPVANVHLAAGDALAAAMETPFRDPFPRAILAGDFNASSLSSATADYLRDALRYIAVSPLGHSTVAGAGRPNSDIDHIWVRRGLVTGAWRGGVAFWMRRSDHLPVVARVELPWGEDE